jgi:aspartyl-tRNA(Asn)/glutamyl-tRNA(Gln) amidotransferase subunit B
LKNINSFRFIEKAIQFEQLRHQDMLESGQVIAQETRLYNPDKNQTELMRSKEDENDYRYFPDPDLLPIHISESELARLKNTLPPLPTDITKHLQQSDALTDDHIDFLLTSPSVIAFYHDVKVKSGAPGKLIVNWLKGAYAAVLNERGLTFDPPPISADTLAELLKKLADNSLSNASAKKIFSQLLTSTQGINDLIAAEQSTQLTDTSELEAIIRTIIHENPQQAADYRAGKDKLLGFFVGLVMKQTKGTAEPSLVNALLIKCLTAE